MHEMGELKRAQELRVDEFSIQKLRESQDTIQRLTSEIQQLQETMDYLSDSGEFQEMESNKFPVNQQGFRVRALCQAATNACHLSHGICLDHRKTFFADPRSTFESSQTHHRGILHSTTPSATGEVPVRFCTGALVARDEERIGSTIPMPTFASRPSTMNSFMPMDISKSSMFGQQRQQISELQFDKFSTPSSFVYWKIRFKNWVTTCSDFPSDAMLWIKEVEMVDAVDELKILAISLQARISRISKCWTRRLLLL